MERERLAIETEKKSRLEQEVKHEFVLTEQETQEPIPPTIEIQYTEKQNETEETNEEPDLDLLKQEEDYVLIGLTGEN